MRVGPIRAEVRRRGVDDAQRGSRPRVDQRARHVDEHVHDDESGREQHRDALDDGEVALVDRCDEQPPEPGKHEDLLDDDLTAEQVAELDPGHRDDRDECVQEQVPPDDGATRDALAARGSHEAEAAHLEHGSAGRAHDRGADAEAQHRRRNDDLLEVEPRVARDARVALRRREVVEMRRQERHEGGADHEARDAEPDHRDALADVVGDLAPVQRADHPETRRRAAARV